MAHDDFNLYTHFAAQFDAQADAMLLETADGDLYRYGDVDALAGRIAACLSGLGVRPGDRVSAQIRKSTEGLMLYLACLKAGFVFHPLNPAYKTAELKYFLNDAGPRVVVCDAGNLAAIGPLAERAGAVRTLTLNADGTGTLTELAASVSPDFDTVPRAKDDLAALLYSSGTTGVPKGIMLTHGNLLSNTQALVDAWDFVPSDRLLHALPVFHVHGLFVGIGCAMLSGASMRWLPAFSPEAVMRFLPECTVMMGVPTYYTRLLAHPDFRREVTQAVRLFVSGSAPLLPETFAEFEARTGHRILERYGMTETNMNTSNPLHGERRPGTVGLPLPGVEVRVCDEAGRVLGAGEIGNLQVRGANVFSGYWQLPEKTAEDFTADGYFNTGDQAVIDADGYVSIVGRARDMIITGGLNVYPKEVEALVDSLPGVGESAVIGVPHPDFGEGVVAIVVPNDEAALEESAVIAACKESLADFKVPKRVIFVPELPRNAMSKVQKSELRDSFAGLFAERRERAS